MKCPKCNETDHPNGAKFCHVCGAKLRSSIPAVEGPSTLSGVIIVLVSIVIMVCVYLLIRHSSFHTYDLIDTASEEAWQNRRLDPHKYDYILNGEPEPEPVTGTLIVDSSPQGAIVYLDGKKTGLKTPATINEITEGKHTVSVKLKKTRINNTWFQMGEKSYPILFTMDKDSISIVRYEDNMAGSKKEIVVIKSKRK